MNERTPILVYASAGLLWGSLLYVCAFLAAVERPATWSDHATLALTSLLLGLAYGVLVTLASCALERLLRRWPRGFDLLQAAALGLGLTWGILSLLKYRTTRVHLRLDDLRFILGSLGQVMAEASAGERWVLVLALVLPIGIGLPAFAGLRVARRRNDSSPGALVALGGLALAGLSLLAWRSVQARFVLMRVAPETHLAARALGIAGVHGFGPEHAFVVEPARHRPIAPYLAPAEFERFHVVVLMLESVPWSRLFGPQARPESTPHLCALAAESTLFSRAYATASHSDYSQTSILSSLHPRRFEHHDWFNDLSYPRTLVWDLLRPLGYRTAVFSCQNERWGNMLSFLHTPGLELLRHSLDWPDAPHRGKGTDSKVFEETPVSAFLEWLADASPAGEPFVAYLNFQATHYPYVLPPGEPEPFKPAADDFRNTFFSYAREKIPVMENRFHNALAYVDRQAGRVIDGLRAAGAWDRTVLLVVSDHGEAFYEHGLPTHGTTLHDEQVRTAMLLRLPDRPGRVVEEPVSVLDAIPAIVHHLGLPEHGNFQGRGDILAPDYNAAARSFPLTIQGLSREDGLVRDGWKLIVDWDRGERELFDLVNDPGERRNLVKTERARAEEMERVLAGLVLEQLAYYREHGWEQGVFAPQLP